MATEGPARVIAAPGPEALVMPAREVPLGGLRAMTVYRALPQRSLPTVGAWCFLDRFGPQAVTMRVEPHPHAGLQTVTWPLTGEIRHRDAMGNDAVLRGGQLNLMTSGAGIAHSEYSLGDGAAEIDALQLWIALPEATRNGPRGFEQHAALPTVTLTASRGDDAEAVVVMGALAGVTSPATTHTPLVGAQVRLAPGSVRVPLEAHWEHAVVLLEGGVAVAAAVDGSGNAHNEPTVPQRNDLLYLGAGRAGIELSSDRGALVFLIGGQPFDDDLVMWWNFVGRSHEEIVEARDDWESGSERFGVVDGHGDVRVPAPPMPLVRLAPRRRRPI